MGALCGILCRPRVVSACSDLTRKIKMVRKIYAFTKRVDYTDNLRGVGKTFYNFCRRHRQLRGKAPATRQSITHHVRTAVKMLSYRGASR